MKDLLNCLNEEQYKAVTETLNKHTLVLAGPGSGKSKTLCTRYIYLVKEKQIDTRNILTITFTNKAAKEMKNRIQDYISQEELNRAMIGTFHSCCIKLMYMFKDIIKLSYFQIIGDGKSVLQDTCKDLLIGMTSKEIIGIVNKISYYKNYSITPNNAQLSAINKYDMICANCYDIYQSYLIKHKMKDFDDIIIDTVKYLEENEEFRKILNYRYKYLLVDECQDTNTMQHKLVKLIGNDNNIFYVGDTDQCWDGESIVNVKCINSKSNDICKIKVKNLQKGMMVETYHKRKVIYSPITNISSNINKIFKITTKLGYTLNITPKHKCFTTLPAFDKDYIYLYIMYRKDKGFRLGLMTGGIYSVIYSRTASERPERLWIINQFKNKNEAARIELYLSLQYKIPTCPFFHNNRGLRMNQQDLDKIFLLFGNNGYKLLDDYNLSFDYPNYIPQSRSENDIIRTNINLIMNSTAGNKIGYEKLGKRNCKLSQDYKTAYNIAKQMMTEINGNMIVEKFSFSKNIMLNVVPAASLFVTMKIPVIHNNKLILDEIISIDKHINKTTVYDIEIAKTGSMIANNILTHNSIYKWRYASPEYFQDFKNIYSGDILYLNTNYRSTPTIVKSAQSLIENNTERFNKVMKAVKNDISPIKIIQTIDAYEESNFVANEINKLISNGYTYNNIAILYRMNSQSRLVEYSLQYNNIPYNIVNGLNFRDRQEIKDMLAYISIIAYPTDWISGKRILKMQSNIGDKTINKIEALDDNVLEAIKKYITKNKRSKIITSLEILIDYYNDWLQYNSIENLISNIYNNCYDKYMIKLKDPYQRIDNIDELINMGIESDRKNEDLSSFLDQLILHSDHDNIEETNVVNLMTGHTSKGLEFKVIFIIGAEENIIPHRNAIMSGMEDEERRLFFVMMTRAEELLYITNCVNRIDRFGQTNTCIPSRFINEIPEQYIIKS